MLVKRQFSFCSCMEGGSFHIKCNLTESDFLNLYPYKIATLLQCKGSCMCAHTHTHTHTRTHTQTCTYTDTQTCPITAPTLKSSVVPVAREWLQNSSTLSCTAVTGPLNRCVKCEIGKQPCVEMPRFLTLGHGAFLRIHTACVMWCQRCCYTRCFPPLWL